MRTAGRKNRGLRGASWIVLALAVPAAWAGLEHGTSCRAGEASPPAVESTPLVPSGGELLRLRGCLECHRLGPEGNQNGVDLYSIGRQMDAGTIDRLLRHPQDLNPAATMQTQRLTRAEALILTDYLSHLR